MNNILKCILCIAVACFVGGLAGYSIAYEKYYGPRYKAGYDAGYTDGYQERNRLVQKEIADAVAANTKTETKIVYQKVPYTGADVQVHTEPPKVTVDINGKKTDIVQHSETADLAVKTETAVKIKVPERRWSVGIGTDGRKAAYMIKAPIKGAVGAWIAGSGRSKIMGGLSISF